MIVVTVFEPNGSLTVKNQPLSYPIQFERKWKYSFFSTTEYQNTMVYVEEFQLGPQLDTLKPLKYHNTMVYVERGKLDPQLGPLKPL